MVSPLAIDLAQQVENCARGFGIERGRGFVGEQHFRIARERPRDAHALLLPAADLRRILVLVRGEADEVEQRQHRRFDFRALLAREFERQRDVAVHRARRQKVEVLKDHADVARGAQVVGAQRREIASIDDHVAFARPRQQIERAHQRALARPLRPMMPNTSPAGIVKLTLCSASTQPRGPAKRCERLRMSIMRRSGKCKRRKASPGESTRAAGRRLLNCRF